MAEDGLSSVVHHHHDLRLIQNTVSEQLCQTFLQHTESACKRRFDFKTFSQ